MSDLKIPPVTLIVDIFEDDTLVVRHTFFGTSQDEATAMFQAHMQADAFLRQCIEGGCYSGNVRCWSHSYWGTS